MPINLASYIQPKNATNPDPALRNTYYLLEDIYIKGGYHIRANVAERDAINELNLKVGMLVYTVEEKKIWQYGEDDTWSELSLAGSGSGGTGSRNSVTHETAGTAPGSFEDFDIEMSSTVALLLQLVVDAPCVVEIHGSALRNDINPYKFIASSSHLSDDGSTVLSDGSVVYGRRFSILANLEIPTVSRVYGRIINSELANVTVKLSLELLPQ